MEKSSNSIGQTQVKLKEKSRSRSQSKSKKKVKCYYCKEYGHYKAKCLKLKNKRVDDKLSFSFVAGVVKEKLEGLELILAITDSDGLFTKWVLDTT